MHYSNEVLAMTSFVALIATGLFYLSIIFCHFCALQWRTAMLAWSFPEPISIMYPLVQMFCTRRIHYSRETMCMIWPLHSMLGIGCHREKVGTLYFARNSLICQTRHATFRAFITSGDHRLIIITLVYWLVSQVKIAAAYDSQRHGH